VREYTTFIRIKEYIRAIAAAARFVESTVLRIAGVRGNDRGNTTWGVNIFYRDMAAGRDAKHGGGTGKQQRRNDQNAQRSAPVLPGQSAKPSFHTCFPAQTSYGMPSSSANEKFLTEALFSCLCPNQNIIECFDQRGLAGMQLSEPFFHQPFWEAEI
jgi:hypothetical protein